jgi:alpha-tubulin suppressor-like RCC1 family protein
VRNGHGYYILLTKFMAAIRTIAPIIAKRAGFGGKRLWIRLILVATLAWCAGVAPASAGNQVIAWGAGTIIKTSDGHDYGQSLIPANLTNAVQVAGGEWHSLALKSDGTLQGWGDDTLGQTYFLDTNNYVAIACGALHSLALQSNGIVAAAGYDGYGETEVPDGLSNVVAIACGFYHSVALQSDGMVVAWGADEDALPVGEVPNLGQTIVPAGLSNIVAIASGGYHTLALKSNGTLVEWGDQASWGGDIPAGLSNVVAIATGAEHNVALIAGGTLAVWGTNTYGQTNVPAGLSNVVAIAAGGWHTLALKKNGTVVAWGAGIGSNTNVDYGQSTVPAGLSNVVQVAAGWVHSLVLKESGPPVLAAPLQASGFTTNGFFAISPSVNGRVYQLEYLNSLTDPNWTTLPLQYGTGGPLELNDPAAASATQRFYRLNRW